MPLSCLDENGDRLHTFDLTSEHWSRLKFENRDRRHLRMPCCGSRVVLKQSRRGTRFFAHAKIGSCRTADESEEHRALKVMAVEVARDCGWMAQTEVSGSTPSGEQWCADVLATKGSARIAIEIQWSGQVDDETLRRQERYRESGVRGLWLLRQPGFPVSHELPAACIGGNIKNGFYALLPYRGARMARSDREQMTGWKSVSPMRDFLRAALSKRLRWGSITKIGARTTAVVLVADVDCQACGVVTDIIVGIELKVSGETVDVSLRDLTPYRSLIEEVRRNLPPSFDQGHLKVRYSRTRNERYFSNGCLGCDRLYGDSYLSGHQSDASGRLEKPLVHSGLN